MIFGEGQDDDLSGQAGNDWISGGAGEDGVIGDDGRIYTSRNGLTETLYGLTSANAQTEISMPGPFTGAWTFITGRLNKNVELEAYTQGGDDIIYGGLGDDFLHGGAGDDGISGRRGRRHPTTSSSEHAGRQLRSATIRRRASSPPTTPTTRSRRSPASS